jgi:predicted RNA binding protein YcfA (HicA-like mRNA interferase family)
MEAEGMTYGELKQLLKKNGCSLRRQGSRHEMWENPKTGKLFPVGRHDAREVCDGMLKAIKRDAGL